MEFAETLFDVRLWDGDEPIGSRLPNLASGCEGLLVMATDLLDAACLKALQARGLRAVGTYSVGYDHIDLGAATALGLPVFHTPDVLSDAVAEIAIFLILATARGTTHAEAQVRGGEWSSWSPTRYMGSELTGRRLGIYGMGRIGRAIAQRARGFGLSIHYHNRSRLPCELESGAIYHPTLDGLMAESDIFCVCAPATRESRHSIDAQRLAILPPGGMVVNIARGDLIVEEALIQAIGSGRLCGAGLDVFQNEPQIDPRFLSLPNTTLLPHIGSATVEARTKMGLMAVSSLDAYLVRGEYSHCLNY